MKHYSEFDTSLELPTLNTNKQITYVNVSVAFDIETTSMYVQENKTAFMYIWMLGIKDSDHIYYGRTWDEFKELCSTLETMLGLSESKRLVVYVHNLSYEFQFIRKHFEWLSVFAVNERKPIKAVTKTGIEFRDSYILSGYSLAKTAENLQNKTIAKLVGDLDYSLIRTHDTVMTKQELGYCKNDIEIVLAYIDEQIEQYGDITKIPLTNTGRVRTYVRNNCYYSSKSHKKSNKGKYSRYRKTMLDLTLTDNDYVLLKKSFMGGYTHGNSNYIGEVLENVSSIDFTSSYPAVMVSEKFPMSRGQEITIKNREQFNELINNYHLVFEVKFINIKPKIFQDNYISESKCHELVNPIINNGRVFSADTLSTTITEIDFKIIEACYSWDNIAIGKAIRFHSGYLPKAIIESVLNLYQDKTTLKGVEDKEVEYLLSKGMLNSIYGMTVTDIVKDNHVYSDDWDIEKVSLSDEIEKYNKSKNRFLFYAWGVYVTAYARRNLWTGILNIGDDYVYSDTDSIKFKNYDKHVGYMNAYNDNFIKKAMQVCSHYNLDSNLLSPKTINGETKTIGIWDFEGTYSRFKTLGAKRYLVEHHNKLELTVAGLSKQNGLNYMLKKCNGNHTQVFKMFNDKLYIPSDETGKMTHTYIDEKIEFTCLDYQNNESHIVTESGIHLEPCEFTLSISQQYSIFLNNLAKGYLYKGVKHV